MNQQFIDFVTHMYTLTEIKIIAFAGILGGIIAKALGGFDTQLIGLLIFMFMDYITGLYAAWHEHKLWSKKAFRGLCKKASILGVVAFCVGLDVVLQIDVCRYGAVTGFGVMEALSIIENADRGGWGKIFPFWIRKNLETIKNNKIQEVQKDEKNNNGYAKKNC